MSATVTDHAALIPTSAGPIGGVVTEPGGPRRAAMFFLQGAGPWGRSGVNAIWKRVAHASGQLGVVVLRIDYPLSRESLMVEGRPFATQQEATDAQLGQAIRGVPDIVSWFREGIGALPLMLAGACVGSRLALLAASREPSLDEMLLVGPRLRDAGHASARPARWVLDAARAIPDSTRVCVLLGEEAAEEVTVIRDCFGREEGDGLEIALVPWRTREQFKSADSQRAVVKRTVAWVDDALRRRDPQRS